MEKFFYIKTYGCQMNFADSHRLISFLVKNGFVQVFSPEQADIIIVNSCSVRKHAEDRMFGYLNSLKPLKKKGKIFCLYGCTANLYGSKILSKYPFIDVVCSPNRFFESIKILQEFSSYKKKVVLQGESNNPFLEEIPNIKNQVSCEVSITKGCNNFCSYCVVPYARGKLISKPPEKILDEVKKLVEKGVKEIVLLGQNVNEYGKDIGSIDFVKLLEEIHKIDGILRIRFLTSHPKDVPENLISSFKNLPKLCKHFHLPLQSGSDKILKLMNRQYTISHYLKIVENVRNFVPDISITSDIIVGFPSETEDDFMETYKFIEKIKFDELFVFKYSPRDGTESSKLKDDVPEEEKEKRHKLILNLQEKITQQINQNYKDRVVEIFVEKESYKKKGYLIGKTETNKPVFFKGDSSEIGKILKVKILEGFTHFLSGEIFSE